MGYLDYTGLQRFLNKLKDTFIPLSQKGAANGVASLNSTGKVPTSQLPDSKVDVYQGEENEDKVLQVNDEGNLELVENPFTVINGTLNVVYYREGE